MARYNEPLYNEDLGVTKAFFFTSLTVKYMSYLNIRSFCNEMNEIW